MLRRPTLVTVAIALVVMLTACTESARIPDAEPSSEGEPLFASDDEALAAATAAYEEFLATSGLILREGGVAPERLRPLVSNEVFESEAEGFQTLRENSWRSTGQSNLEATVLQQHVSGPIGQAEVVVYACVDVSTTDIVNADGVSQVDQSRSPLLGFEVLFLPNDEGRLIIERKTLWDVESACIR